MIQSSLINRLQIDFGLPIAISIIGLWVVSLSYLLTIAIDPLPNWLIFSLVAWQMFLYTGLFITAHDAMHGSVCPRNPKINTLIGKIALLAYALFPYDQLVQKHRLHHHQPASENDPDFHNGSQSHPIFWYFCFMKRYISWRQLIGLPLIYHTARLGLHIPEQNLFLFWILPSVLSSVQLFYFGTFLPHRQPANGYTNQHRAETTELPVFWSFLTCYHFGYHEEHHEYPHLSWWQLPTKYEAKRNEARSI